MPPLREPSSALSPFQAEPTHFAPPATQSQIWPIRVDSEGHPALAPKGLPPAVWTRSLGDAGVVTGISIMGSHGPKV